MYRSRTTYSKLLKIAREAKEAKRLASPAPDYPIDLPDLRRELIVIDYDSGQPVEQRLEMHRSDRSDCYDVYVGGQIWKRRIGWSRILAAVRKSLPRVSVI